MARPRKEGMDYFPHDTDAANDEKIEALRALYGNDGYAFYFIMLERIYRTPSFELKVSDAETRQILSRKIAITEEKFNQILLTALRWNCFDNEAYEKRGVLTSDGIKKRAQIVVEKRVKMRKRYENKEEISAAETTSETRVETPQSKVKQSKVKQSKAKHLSQDLNPSFAIVEKEFSSLTGRLILSPKDLSSIQKALDIADAELIIKTMQSVQSKTKSKIRTFAYFLPAIEDSVRDINKPDPTQTTLERYRRMG